MTRTMERQTQKLKAGERVRLSREGLRRYTSPEGKLLIRSEKGIVTKKQIGLNVQITLDGWGKPLNFHPDFWERENG